MPGQFLDDFKSRMTSFARPNLFEVVINPKGSLNSSLVSIPSSLNRRLTFGCYSASIPGMSTAATEKDEHYRSIAYQKIYEDVNLGFYVHGDMKEIEVFQDWMKLMIRPHDNHVGFYDDYTSTIEIKSLNRQQDIVLTTTLYDAYPKSLAAVALEYGTNDDVMKIEVGITYRNYIQKFGGRQETVGRPVQKESDPVEIKEDKVKGTGNLKGVHRNESNKDFMARMLGR